MVKSYRQSHTSADSAKRYERRYSETNHDTMLWSLEQALILRELTRLRKKKPRIDYLDFACGTGRVLSFLEPKVESAAGIDIAESMLAVARCKVKNARLMCKDVSLETGPPEAHYDLITAFRFLLNAEQPLRIAAIRALAQRLRDRESRLIVNNHNNLMSYKILAWPVYRLRHAISGCLMPNYLTLQKAKRIFMEAGLELVAAHGYGQFSARVLHMLPLSQLHKIESALVDAPLLWHIATQQIYVARLRK
jgi:2-polyprenyl-3-methyl-5-hydroxy-6-metoxy-1,4-benzoquinol methylase